MLLVKHNCDKYDHEKACRIYQIICLYYHLFMLFFLQKYNTKDISHILTLNFRW